jgi:hypothetical protein
LLQAIPSTRNLAAGPAQGPLPGSATSDGGGLPKLAERPVWKPREDSLSPETGYDNCSPEAQQQNRGDIPTRTGGHTKSKKGDVRIRTDTSLPEEMKQAGNTKGTPSNLKRKVRRNAQQAHYPLKHILIFWIRPTSLEVVHTTRGLHICLSK